MAMHNADEANHKEWRGLIYTRRMVDVAWDKASSKKCWSFPFAASYFYLCSRGVCLRKLWTTFQTPLQTLIKMHLTSPADKAPHIHNKLRQSEGVERQGRAAVPDKN
eukprot:1158174-Pelagomonas_calceolata.AAC.12